MSLKIKFDTPVHGWMGITLKGDEQDYREFVSHVSNDCLLRFCWSLIRLTQGMTEDRCEWFLEPDYSVWKFHREGENILFTVEIEGSEVFRHRSSLHSFLLKGRNALQRLSRDPCWEGGVTPDWTHPFPHQDLAHLSRLLEREKTQGLK